MAQRSVRRWVAVVAVVAVATVVAAAIAIVWVMGSSRGDVLVIGDSLTVLAQGEGLSRGGWDIDAEVGRRTAEGIEVAKERDADAYQVVIVALGSNDRPGDVQAFEQQVTKMMAVIGSKPRVAWVNVDSGAPGLSDAVTVNRAFRDAARTHPNLQIGDWNHEVETTPGLPSMRTSDGIHYDREGSALRARWTLQLGERLLQQTRDGLLAGSVAWRP